jgi:pentatricopeptide repeat protein
VSLFGAASEKRHAKVITKAWRAALYRFSQARGSAFSPRPGPGPGPARDEMINSEVGSAAIIALGRCENWPAAFQVWRDMRDVGEPRSLYVYTAMLTVLRDNARWEEAAEVFRAMRDEEGVSPNAMCAGMMLAAFDAARQARSTRVRHVVSFRFVLFFTRPSHRFRFQHTRDRVRGSLSKTDRPARASLLFAHGTTVVDSGGRRTRSRSGSPTSTTSSSTRSCITA